MAHAIANTFKSVSSSSVTTIAGFIALCFMTFKLGTNIGVVMSKGVVIGVVACVTILPAMILTFDKAIEKTSHKALIPSLDNVSHIHRETSLGSLDRICDPACTAAVWQ